MLGVSSTSPDRGLSLTDSLPGTGSSSGGFVVRRVRMPVTGAQSWTVIGPDRLPVEPVESYLAWLGHIERSPNTVRAYAHDLKLYCSGNSSQRRNG